MANRVQRRAAAAAQRQSLVREYRKGGKIAGLIQNGITSDDLERKYQEGRRYGFQEASMPMLKTCIAAAAIVLHDEFGFDEDQVFRGISEIGNKMLYCLNNQDLVNETIEKTGIDIQMDDVLEPVQRV